MAARFALPLLLASAALAAGCAAPRTTAQTPPPAHGAGPAPGRVGTFPPVPRVVPGAAEAAAAVRAVLDAQVAAWNAGDVRGFMAGYARTDSLVFVSNGQMRLGWQPALYAYMRSYPDQAAMGTLSFEDMDVDVIAPDVALVRGVFRLIRAEDEPLGVFTLVFRLDPEEGWKIVLDHTSSSP